VGKHGTGVDLAWSPADGVSFTIETGSVSYLKSFGTFQYSCQVLVVSNYAGTDYTLSSDLSAGNPWYYFVRGKSCSGAQGSFSSGAPSERPGRDAELSIPHGTCP